MRCPRRPPGQLRSHFVWPVGEGLGGLVGAGGAFGLEPRLRGCTGRGSTPSAWPAITKIWWFNFFLLEKLMTSWRHILYNMLMLVMMQTVAAPTKVAMASSRCMSWGCSGRSGGSGRRVPPIWAATNIWARATSCHSTPHWYISIWGLGCSQDGFGENQVK